MITKIIAITGLKGSGKTEISKYLVSHYAFERISFADPLKEMLRTMGLTYEQLWGQEKEISSTLLEGATPRHAMQTLGTEWGRNLIAYDLWSNVWKNKVEHTMSNRIVTDDMRFRNEATMVKNLGGHIITVERPGQESKDTHISETETNTVLCDFKIINDGSIFMLKASVDKVMEKI